MPKQTTGRGLIVMKRLVFSGAMLVLAVAAPGHAADVTDDTLAYDWTGPYLGAFAAYTFGTVHGDAGCCTDDFGIEGFQAGGFAGYNFAFGSLIAGAEADAGFMDVSGVGFGGGVDDFDVSPMARLRGRVGLPVGNFLPFIAAGLSAGDGDARIPGDSVPSEWHLGFNVGLGTDFALTENLALRAEYVFDSMFAETYGYNGGNVEYDWNSSTIRLGALVRF
jgi:outer membrane immunogenic protein